MQQLNTYADNVKYHLQAQRIDIVTPLPDSQEAGLELVAMLAKQWQATCVEVDQGADRIQAFLTLQDCRFILNIEWLCEAIWIELGSDSGTLDTQQNEIGALFDQITTCKKPANIPL